MQYFKTRFLYPLYLLLLVLALVASGMFLYLMYILIPIFFTKFSATDVGMFLCAVFLFGYLALQFDYIAITLRYGFIITDNRISSIDHLLWRRIDITDKIKGYSSSYFGNKNDIPCIIIYLNNKKHINMPRYLFYDFYDIEDALKEFKIPYLGEEPFFNKFVIAREYKFDKV